MVVEGRGTKVVCGPPARRRPLRALVRRQGVYDGRDTQETAVYLPEQRALVFADGMTAPDGELRVWATPWHEERVLPAMRALLDLPFELVLVSHGEPVHAREDFVAALDREPWSHWTGA
jgi:broad specificity phosphatase PhoE